MPRDVISSGAGMCPSTRVPDRRRDCAEVRHAIWHEDVVVPLRAASCVEKSPAGGLEVRCAATNLSEPQADTWEAKIPPKDSEAKACQLLKRELGIVREPVFDLS